MSLPILQPEAFYGLRTDIKGNAQYITDHDIMYPVGGVVAFHNFINNEQNYLKFPDKTRTINIICLSPLRNVVAFAETGEKPAIIICDVSTLKRKKTLGLPLDTSASEFASICFTYDNKYLIGIVGDPDWLLVCYNWEKGKIESSTRANNPNNPGPVTQVACNPADNTVVCVVGPGLFRLLNVAETVWRQYGFQKADAVPITCCCWLNFDRIAVGTTDGRILIIEGGDLKYMYKALEVTVIDMRTKDENVSGSLSITNLRQRSSESLESDSMVNEIISFAKGFAFACGFGTIHLFEVESKHKYHKTNVIKIIEGDIVENMMDPLTSVKCLSMNVTGDQLLASTHRTQLYFINLWNKYCREHHEIHMEKLGEPLHHGSINGMAICPWKQIFVTCGEDKTVRLWNYQLKRVELIKQFQEEISCVALHPTGLYIAIGFIDKLRFMMLLIDDIQPMREFPIRNCQKCEFSSSGHLFAAVNETLIEIYSSVSFQQLYILRGHNGKIQSLVWTPDDTKLVSCGAEGAVYEWVFPKGSRQEEIITKSCSYTGVAVTSDGKTSFAVGTDGQIKEINKSLIVRAMPLTNLVLVAIVMSRSNLMIFVAIEDGTILSVRFPLVEPLDFIDYNYHNKLITSIHMTYDDRKLITCSVDGSVCIWNIGNVEGKTVILDKAFKYSDAIIISKQDLQEKVNLITDLAMRINELQTEHSYQVKQKDQSYSEKIKGIHESYIQAIEELKDKIETLEVEHVQETIKLNSEIEHTKFNHDKEMQEMEASFNAKLIVEYEKYTQLELSKQKMREDYETQLTELGKAKDDFIDELRDLYEKQINIRNDKLDEAEAKAQKVEKEHEAVLRQIEDDADREIVELKSHYEQSLFEEKETIVHLRGDLGVMRKKFLSSLKDVDEYKHQVHILQSEHEKLQNIINSLERDIQDLKKEINERDAILQDKERIISELKRNNQELDKYKIVLGYKIDELKSEIEPKDQEIQYKKEQMLEMEKELEHFQVNNMSASLQLSELKEKLASTDLELQKEISRGRKQQAKMQRILTDLHDASALVQDPHKLKEAVKKLYHKYAAGEEFCSTHLKDMDTQAEFLRQREHLERTVAVLKKQANKQFSGKHDDVSKILDENVQLLAEINKLRKERKEITHQIGITEALLGVSIKNMTPKEAQAKLAKAVQSREEIHQEYQNKIQELEKLISIQKEEIQRLIRKLSEEQRFEHHREQIQQRKNRLKT